MRPRGCPLRHRLHRLLQSPHQASLTCRLLLKRSGLQPQGIIFALPCICAFFRADAYAGLGLGRSEPSLPTFAQHVMVRVSQR